VPYYVVVWAALAAAAVGCEVAGWLAHAGRMKSRLAPLEHVLTAVRSKGPGRAVLVVSWAWLGWHLFAR
jgi:hypothetical protein